MSDDSTESADARPEAGTGFGTAEKAVGAWAAYKHPLVSGVVAGKLLESETDPVRKRQLTEYRQAAFLWWGVGIVIAIVLAILVFSNAAGHGFGGGSCSGRPDKFDVMSITYESDDNGKHWTATYPCTKGGSTTVPVPRRAVPGGGR